MYGPQVREDVLTRLGQGQSLSRVSADTGVSRATLRHWRSTGGAYSSPMRSKAVCPRGLVLDGPAEYSHLLGLYLGDGCISAGPRGVYRLRISCDAKYQRLIDDCARSMHEVVPNVVGFVHAPGCIVVGSTSRHWPCLFPQHGPGPKHERRIALTDWQRALVQAQAGAFVRGLFDSDGCRVTNWTVRDVAGYPKRYEYPRYLFSNTSLDIIRLCEWGLDLLGVSHRRPRHDVVSVARRASVAVMEQVVGPKS